MDSKLREIICNAKKYFKKLYKVTLHADKKNKKKVCINVELISARKEEYFETKFTKNIFLGQKNCENVFDLLNSFSVSKII